MISFTLNFKQKHGRFTKVLPGRDPPSGASNESVLVILIIWVVQCLYRTNRSWMWNITAHQYQLGRHHHHHCFNKVRATMTLGIRVTQKRRRPQRISLLLGTLIAWNEKGLPDLKLIHLLPLRHAPWAQRRWAGAHRPLETRDIKLESTGFLPGLLFFIRWLISTCIALWGWGCGGDNNRLLRLFRVRPLLFSC